ncbi:hypothetical protein WSM22_19780 [Cytophagales bacterium WSM2-2]|nr:hypothetical protein WSM22_19780 [Cytophagales bacterium WSM2-2]
MERRDYLKKQIDQLGRVLGKLLLDLTGFKNQQQIEFGFENTNQVLKQNLGLNVGELSEIEHDQLLLILKNEKRLSDEALNALSEILWWNADHTKDTSTRKNLYQQCLTILEYLETHDTTYSLDRHFKIEKLRVLSGNSSG